MTRHCTIEPIYINSAVKIIFFLTEMCNAVETVIMTPYRGIICKFYFEGHVQKNFAFLGH